MEELHSLSSNNTRVTIVVKMACIRGRAVKAVALLTRRRGFKPWLERADGPPKMSKQPSTSAWIFSR